VKKFVLPALLLTSEFSVAGGAETAVPKPDFLGAKAGDERTVAGIKLCWCPPGKFMMGSPRNEPERRPDEEHDLHGNIFEWCRDWYHSKLPGGVDPDLYLATASSRVRRGGCWMDEGWPCRSAARLRFEPERRYDHIGFRVVAVKP